MKKSRLLRSAVLAMALWGWGLAARADLVYDVTGTFGTTVFTGPLNGGTFSGTFDGALPANSSESITTYSVGLISASGLTLADLQGREEPDQWRQRQRLNAAAFPATCSSSPMARLSLS